jgi:hypothetical protein
MTGSSIVVGDGDDSATGVDDTGAGLDAGAADVQPVSATASAIAVVTDHALFGRRSSG